MMLQFDNDQNNASYANITIAFDQNFTVCFAFMIDKLTADYNGRISFFEWQSEVAGGGWRKLSIYANVYSGNISIVNSDGTGISIGTYTEHIALSTWRHICYSSTDVLVVNRFIVHRGDGGPTLQGDTSLRFGLLGQGQIVQLKSEKTRSLAKKHHNYTWTLERLLHWGATRHKWPSW